MAKKLLIMHNPNKPFSQACENNKIFILEKLKQHFRPGCEILEVGSGTGQHAAYFANHLPDIIWQTSDLPENHPGINAWIDDPPKANLLKPLELNVQNKEQWPIKQYDAIFSANTFHIMPWSAVLDFFKMAKEALTSTGQLVYYGPLKINGEHTSASNEQFDVHLKSQAQHMGIRDLLDITDEAGNANLQLNIHYKMPANNLLLMFSR